MKTILTYTHSRNLFIKNEFKPFVKKYFKDVEFIGFESGYWEPSISISNWGEIKDILPKSYYPESVRTDTRDWIDRASEFINRNPNP